MRLQLIRNATMRLTYGGQYILTDPYLGQRHAYKPLAGREANPTALLPVTLEEVVDGIGMVLVSHLHNDHFDPVAQQVLPKDLPIFCQPEDAERIAKMGFQEVTPVEDNVAWEGISITRTPGTHGKGKWGEQLNPVSGFILRAEGEPVIYWCGDTIWYEAIEQIVQSVRPDIIITHSCGAELGDSGPIVMDAQQTIAVCHTAIWAKVVAVHMDAVDHATVSRTDLRKYADTRSISPSQLWIPADGEKLTF